MIGELCGDLKNPQYQDTTLNVLFFSLHVGLCQQNVHFLIIRSSRERRKCDTRPCHTYTHVQTNMFVNVWACRTPFAPEPYCCLDSDWLRGVWKSTSVELQGGRPLVLPLPTLPLWFSTRSNLWARKRPSCSPHYLSSMAKFWDFLLHSSFRHAIVRLSKSMFPIWRNIH